MTRTNRIVLGIAAMAAAASWAHAGKSVKVEVSAWPKTTEVSVGYHDGRAYPTSGYYRTVQNAPVRNPSGVPQHKTDYEGRFIGKPGTSGKGATFTKTPYDSYYATSRRGGAYDRRSGVPQHRTDYQGRYVGRPGGQGLPKNATGHGAVFLRPPCPPVYRRPVVSCGPRIVEHRLNPYAWHQPIAACPPRPVVCVPRPVCVTPRTRCR